MSILIKKQDALPILEAAYNDRFFVDDEIGRSIETVLRGSHKTFRYVLVTALLAKATNEEVNPIILQKAANEPGCYNPRTLCSSTLTPFEQEHFFMGIGNSRDPLVNNPARVPKLTKENVTRSGSDEDLQNITLYILECIDTKQKAFKYLKCALFVAKTISEEKALRYRIEVPVETRNILKQTIYDYINKLVSKSCKGESCVLAVASIEQLYRGNQYIVNAHKSNESGQSSNEVGDIDVFSQEGNLAYSIEVKDKNYQPSDMEFTIRTYIDAGLKYSMFIYGMQADFDRKAVFNIARRFGTYGHFCSVISITDYIKLRMLELPEICIEEYINILLSISREICAKQETVDWVHECYGQIQNQLFIILITWSFCFAQHEVIYYN